MLGTADYVAPEQVENGLSDARSDVYSLACVAYHVLAGAPPFRRESEIATLIAQTKAERPAASAANPRLPPALDEPLRAGMALDPESRPATARTFVESLASAASGGAGSGPPTAGSESPTAPMRRRPAARLGSPARLAAALLAVAALIALAVGAGALLSDGVGEGTGEPSSETSEILTERVGRSPVGVAVGERRVWVAVRDEKPFSAAEPGEIQRLKLRRPVPQKEPVALPSARAVAVGPTSTWAVNGEALFEVGGGRQPRRVEVGEGPSDVAVDKDYVWTTNEDEGSVSRVTIASLASGDPEVKTVEVGEEPHSIAVRERAVWVACAGAGTVERLNPETLRAAEPIAVGPRPTSIAVGPSSVWVTDSETSAMLQIDVAEREVVGEPIALAAKPRGVAVGLSSVWVASGAENLVEQFDARSRSKVAEFEVAADPADVTVGEKAVYTANQRAGSVSRIEP